MTTGKLFAFLRQYFWVFGETCILTFCGRFMQTDRTGTGQGLGIHALPDVSFCACLHPRPSPTATCFCTFSPRLSPTCNSLPCASPSPFPPYIFLTVAFLGLSSLPAFLAFMPLSPVCSRASSSHLPPSLLPSCLPSALRRPILRLLSPLYSGVVGPLFLYVRFRMDDMTVKKLSLLEGSTETVPL